MGDINQDGLVDVIAAGNNSADQFTGELAWWQRINGQIRRSTIPNPFSLVAVDTVDVDNDLDLDIVAVSRLDQRVVLFINQLCDGDPAPPEDEMPTSGVSGVPINIGALDWNGDFLPQCGETYDVVLDTQNPPVVPPESIESVPGRLPEFSQFANTIDLVELPLSNRPNGLGTRLPCSTGNRAVELIFGAAIPQLD